jgi:glycine/D-amino acid oxidase-like deaminating enzyme
VAIVGAGYTGLSTALHLAEAGVSVCVLDAHAPGWGASGRNGGQVIPGLKYDPDQLRVMFGSAEADPLIAAIGSAADTVFDLIAATASIAMHSVPAGSNPRIRPR